MDWEQPPVVFRGYPIPPSDNALKRPVRRFAKGGHGRVLAMADSPDYIAYRSAVNIWRMRNFANYSEELGRVLAWYRAGRPLGVQLDVRVHQARLYTKEGKARRWDVTNLAKAVHDTFGAITGVDDSAFFDCRQRKVKIETDRAECVYLLIAPIQRSNT